MQVDIVTGGAVTLEMMRDLGQLCEQLRGAGVEAHGSRAVVPGVKDAGLTVAIGIVGLVVSGLSALVSVLTYWSSTKPRYTLTVQAGATTLTLSQLDKKGVQAALKQLQTIEESAGIVVRVSER